MSFTSNTRDEVTLIFLKHKYRENVAMMREETLWQGIRQAALWENAAILKTFAEVRERNALGKQAGSYEAIGQICDEFFAAAEPAQVG